MRYPLRYAAYELLKGEKSVTDDELLEALNKNGVRCSMNELNKVLMQLEILGLISVRWISKDKRSIEFIERQEGEAVSEVTNEEDKG